MNKAIVVLTGIPKGKTQFDKIAKQNGYWIWNINSNNVLSVLSRSMGWKGVRNAKYYEFLDKLSKLVDEYWEFKRNYLADMICKFKEDEKATLLVIHGAGRELTEDLRETAGAYMVNIQDSEEDEKPYEIQIYMDESSFEQNILRVLEFITR